MEKVLLVEDEEGIRKVVVRVLVSLGHAVVEAASAEQAIEVLDDSFDLIITDWDMGAMSGPDFIRFVRGKVEWHYERLPILLMTGRGEEDAREALDAGATAVLHKPFAIDGLKEAVQKIVK